MSLLADHQIRAREASGSLVIDPWDPTMVQPASYDVALGPAFRTLRRSDITNIDIADVPANLTEEIVVREWWGHFILHPGEFVLAHTVERVELPNDLAARVEGKSGIGRLGLAVHVTAGFIDPGFRGEITLEMVNLAPVPIKLRPNRLVAQLSFYEMSAPAERPYGDPALASSYQDSSGVIGSRYGRGTRKSGWADDA